MQPAPSDEITRLLSAFRDGDQAARAELASLLYPQMRTIARNLMRRERPDHTLQPTALVNEAYLRVFGDRIAVENRAHFLAIAAQVMRQILVDYARQRKAAKRGGDAKRVDLEAVNASSEMRTDMLLRVDEALTRLAEWDERQSRIVEMRFFGGLTEEEIAEVLAVSLRTVKRDWSLAKAWLYTELGK
ncbi:MAG: sigma-70 family RNA polymerase sigma factor [Bryobacteraceae bacterium]|nr:sigma-70 family RNA polymerase sigma factor [Bryobacteraceae bacterium]